MVGAGRSHPGDPRGWPGWHGAQRRAAYARHRTARLGVGPAVVPVRIPAGPGGGHASGRTARRPVRPQEGADGIAGAVRCRVGTDRLLDHSGRLHRGPRGARRGRGRHHRDGPVGAHRAVHRGGTAQGGRRLVRRQLPRAADRADPGRLDADAPLVGLGVPDQRAGRPGRTRRHRAAGPGVPGVATSWGGHGRDCRLGCRAGQPDLRLHPSRPVRLGEHQRGGPDDRGRRGAGRILPVRALAQPPGRRAAH